MVLLQNVLSHEKKSANLTSLQVIKSVNYRGLAVYKRTRTSPYCFGCRENFIGKTTTEPIKQLYDLEITEDFPVLHELLIFISTLPSNTPTPERMFSNLKFIKNKLRSTQKCNRLNQPIRLYTESNISLGIMKNATTVRDILEK